MARYKPTNFTQDAFVPLCFDKQILPGTFEHALHHLLEHKVDLSAFDAQYARTGVKSFLVHGFRFVGAMKDLPPIALKCTDRHRILPGASRSPLSPVMARH